MVELYYNYVSLVIIGVVLKHVSPLSKGSGSRRISPECILYSIPFVITTNEVHHYFLDEATGTENVCAKLFCHYLEHDLKGA